MGAKNFGPQGPPGVTSSFLRSVKIFFWNFSKQLLWLEPGHQVDQKTCKNHVLKFIDPEIWPFEKCIKYRPRIYRQNTKMLIIWHELLTII